MHVTRIEDAKPYEAKRHVDVTALRLQGLEASNVENFNVGLSYYLPSGCAEKSSSPLERVYLVLDGEITVTIDGKDTVLKALDSCHIPPNEEREVVNKTNKVATMLVIMPTPKG